MGSGLQAHPRYKYLVSRRCLDFPELWFPHEEMCVCANSLHSCLTPCNPMDCSPPGSSVHGILQARILEWVAVPSTSMSNEANSNTYTTTLRVLVAQLCMTLCDPMDYIAHQGLLSMEFSRQGYWNGLPFPSPGDLPNQGLNLGLLHCRRMPYHLSY